MRSWSRRLFSHCSLHSERSWKTAFVGSEYTPYSDSFDDRIRFLQSGPSLHRIAAILLMTGIT